MGVMYVGRNGSDYDMDRKMDMVVMRLMKQLTGEAVSLVPSSEQECKRWAAWLRSGKIKLLRYKIGAIELAFEVVNGENIRQLFTTGAYKRHGKWIDISKLELAPLEPLDEYRNTMVLEFADFLDSSGGLVTPK